MSRTITLNPIQKEFVLGKTRHSAYVGGVGSGKSFASALKGLMHTTQKKEPGQAPPTGCFLTNSYPSLKDIAIPTFKKVMELTGTEYTYRINDKKFVLPANGGEILLRSLDRPDNIRGIEICWFGIDEGRNFDTDYPYKIMTGRMRQKGYPHAGWVSSTPNGYDWMYHRFHEKGRRHLKDSAWYAASVYDNRHNVGEEYIEDLENQYEGRFLRQELYGEFIGTVDGAVFPGFDPDKHVRPVEYRDDLPLYSFWDFGVGDTGVCLFAQVEWNERPGATKIHYIPTVYIIGAITMAGASIAEWADAYFRHCNKYYHGNECYMSWGDPAGAQTNMVSGTSALEALNNNGVRIRGAPRRPKDEAIIIVENLIEGDRLVIDSKLEEVAEDVQSYRWKVDDDGNRLSPNPIHSKHSHVCDAIQYGALGVVGLHPRRVDKPKPIIERGTYGFIREQLLNQGSEHVEMGMSPKARIDWYEDEQLEQSEMESW